MTTSPIESFCFHLNLCDIPPYQEDKLEWIRNKERLQNFYVILCEVDQN